jgi:hypothetical protein
MEALSQNQPPSSLAEVSTDQTWETDMTSNTKTDITRRRALAWMGGALGGALGATLLGAGAAEAAHYYTFPRIQVRGDRSRLGWTSANVTVSVNAPDNRAVQALQRVSRDVENRVKRLLSSQSASTMLDQREQRGLQEEIAKIVLRAAPRGSIQQITDVSMLVYP